MRWLIVVLGVGMVCGQTRPRAREAGVVIGVLPVGALNSITDVAGVRVGQVTLRRGENIRTGVTAILPHAGNLFQEKVPAALFVGNGFGKLLGSTQVEELGELETPILLTSTLNVPEGSLASWRVPPPHPAAVTASAHNPVIVLLLTAARKLSGR